MKNSKITVKKGGSVSKKYVDEMKKGVGKRTALSKAEGTVSKSKTKLTKG